MQPRTFCFIAVFVGYGYAFAFFALATPVVVTEQPTSTEQKVLLDCKNTDYRTYIQCLKRQKRHHLHRGDNHEFDPECAESCFKKCETEYDCDKKCNHCLKKTKRKHQIITEYETECTSGDCSKDGTNSDHLRSTNITTKIDINNIISNGGCCPTCKPPIPCVTPSPPVNPCDRPCYPQQCPQCYPNSFSPNIPQLSLVPQLTLGFGLGFNGGCPYPSPWPCSPPPYHPGGGHPIDCSGCGTAYAHLRCDVKCYQTTGLQTIPQYNYSILCSSPECVGGSLG